MSKTSESILIPSNFSNTTGFAWNWFFRVFDHIAATLHERGIGVVLCFAEVEGEVDVLREDVPYEVIVFDPWNLSVGSVLRLMKHIREHGVRYVYWTDFATWHWLYALMRLSGVRRIVVHSHISVPNPHPAPPETGLKRFVKRAIHRIRWLSADHVLTCSEFVQQRLTDKACYPEERITVIPYGLPENYFRPAGEPEGDGEKDVVRVFCAARAVRVKGIHVLIEATRLLRARDDLPPFRVEFAGDGPDLSAFERQAEEAELGEHFRFLGYVDGVADLIAGADVVVSPSIWGDAFLYSVLEAMAMSKAIVTSRAGGIPEQIGSEDCGVLVPPGDAEALADGLAEVISDRDARRRLGENAGRRARERFREEDYLAAVMRELDDSLRLSTRAVESC